MICKNCGHNVTLKKGVCPDCEVFVGDNVSAQEAALREAEVSAPAKKKVAKTGGKRRRK